MSARAAAKHFNISRGTVDKMLAFSVPPGYRRDKPIRRPKLDGFTQFIDAWLEADKAVHRKQRHTGKRIWERLQAEHGYTIVKDDVRERERRTQEMFVPLAHSPGHAPADFGEAVVVIGGIEQKAHFFVIGLPHSDAYFVRAYPAATAEA
jgi:transposase